MGLDASADPRFATVTLRTDCPRCGAHVPVNRPDALVRCGDCGAEVTVPREWFRRLFDAFEVGWPKPLRESRPVDDLTFRVTLAPAVAPPCPACGGARGGDPGRCAACGAALVDEEPPHWLAPLVARVSRPVVAPTPPPAPVALSCPACGAGLTIDAAAPRHTPCGHCGSQVHLPETLWRQLHPPRTVVPWVVRFDGESRFAAEVRREREKREANHAAWEREKAENVARADAATAARLAREAAAAAEPRPAARSVGPWLGLGVVAAVAICAGGLLGVVALAGWAH